MADAPHCRCRYSEEALTVHRGALLYSLPIAPNYTVVNVHPFDSRDLQLLPTSEWRYALVVRVSVRDLKNHTKNPTSRASSVRLYLQAGDSLLPYTTRLCPSPPTGCSPAS